MRGAEGDQIMPVVYSPESEYAKELARWDTPKRLGGMNANGFEAFPRMLYKAFPHPQLQGKVLCGDPRMATGLYVDAKDIVVAESFTRQCQRTVRDQEELDRASKEGWVCSPSEALAAYERAQQQVGEAAAEEAYRVQRMSAPAQAEFTAYEETTEAHVAEMPAPKRKRKRHPWRKKVAAVTPVEPEKQS
jgi:hypothetical protein